MNTVLHTCRKAHIEGIRAETTFLDDLLINAAIAR
jgi:hypothetical protein